MVFPNWNMIKVQCWHIQKPSKDRMALGENNTGCCLETGDSHFMLFRTNHSSSFWPVSTQRMVMRAFKQKILIKIYKRLSGYDRQTIEDVLTLIFLVSSPVRCTSSFMVAVPGLSEMWKAASRSSFSLDVKPLRCDPVGGLDVGSSEDEFPFSSGWVVCKLYGMALGGWVWFTGGFSLDGS